VSRKPSHSAHRFCGRRSRLNEDLGAARFIGLGFALPIFILFSGKGLGVVQEMIQNLIGRRRF